MRVKFIQLLFCMLAVGLCSAAVFADQIPVGFVSYDFTTPPGSAQFDVTNQTGPNSSTFPDTTWPVTNSISLESLSLTVDFVSGPPQVFGSGFFSLEPDGLSFSGPLISLGNPATSATLTGTFLTTTFDLNDGSIVNVLPSFSATITDASGTLQDQDFAVIYANTTTPEPGTWTLLGMGLILLLLSRRKSLARLSALITSGRGGLRTVLFLTCLVLIPSLSKAQVKLNTWTMPSQGFAGQNQLNVTGSAFPAGIIHPSAVTVSVASTCGGSVLATASGLAVTHILGTSDRIEFLIPASLAPATYAVSITGTTTGGTHFSSTNCSDMKVLPPKVVLNSCLPSSSLGVLLPASGPGAVTAYVPNGAWDFNSTGVQVVPVEGGGSPASIATPNTPNSCASNSATGESVCVANNTDIYLITGSTLNSTLTSGSTASAGFSGGECENCGVAINSLTNTAVITMGLAGSPSGGGLQFLDLGTSTLGAPIPASNEVSEDVQWDPGRKLILSPNEGGTYDLFNTSASPPSEFGNFVGSYNFDSAAEDCTTGIALASVEFADEMYIGDLTQATFVPGSPGTWTAPAQVQAFPEFDEYPDGPIEYGIDGIAVAPGSHLAVISGEFGGNTFGVFTLPSTSGSGTPSFGAYAAAALPPTPDGAAWNQGLDPHTITAYVSPNNGRPYGVMANGDFVAPTYLAVIDLQALLSAPRVSGIYPDGTPCASCTQTVDPTYNLLTHGVVTYFATH